MLFHEQLNSKDIFHLSKHFLVYSVNPYLTDANTISFLSYIHNDGSASNVSKIIGVYLG